MHKHNIPFIKYKFDNAFIISPWVYLFEKKPGWNGSEPYYCVEILVHKKDPTLQMLNNQLTSYEKDKIVRLGYYKLVRDINCKNHDQEIEIFTNKGHSIQDYIVLYLKRKSGEPDLVSQDNQKLERIPTNQGLFTRGTKVNVIASLGVNQMAGQPYLSLAGIQHVSPGFSEFIKPTVNPTAFTPVGTPTSYLGNGGAAYNPHQAEEDALNAMLAQQLIDDEETVPF